MVAPGRCESLPPRPRDRRVVADFAVLAPFDSNSTAFTIGRAASPYPRHALLFAIKPGTVRTLKRLGSNPVRTWSQVNGMDTGAPGRIRGDHGLTEMHGCH